MHIAVLAAAMSSLQPLESLPSFPEALRTPWFLVGNGGMDKVPFDSPYKPFQHSLLSTREKNCRGPGLQRPTPCSVEQGSRMLPLLTLECSHTASLKRIPLKGFYHGLGSVFGEHHTAYVRVWHFGCGWGVRFGSSGIFQTCGILNLDTLHM